MNTTKRQLEILLEFGKVINRTRTLNSVLEAMADFARDILQADRCSIFIYDKNTDELADIMEVVYALASLHDCTSEELEKLRAEKAEKRGGFDKKIFLIEVTG